MRTSATQCRRRSNAWSAGVSPAGQAASRRLGVETTPIQPARTPARPVLLIAFGVFILAMGVFLALPAAQPLLAKLARSGIAMLQHRGYLRLPSSVYEARLAGYLAGFATVALRRIAVPTNRRAGRILVD